MDYCQFRIEDHPQMHELPLALRVRVETLTHEMPMSDLAQLEDSTWLIQVPCEPGLNEIQARWHQTDLDLLSEWSNIIQVPEPSISLSLYFAILTIAFIRRFLK